MKKYRVLVEELTPGEIDVEAEDKDSAAEKALRWDFIERGETRTTVVEVLELDEYGNTY
jgi:hypothetical protein